MKLTTRSITLNALFLLASITLNGQSFNDTMSTVGPGRYEILTDENDIIEIPFTIHNGKPLMQVKINGKAATLMIDNGVLWDQVWLFGSPLVDALDLRPLEEGSLGGAGEGDPTALYFSSNLTLQFQDVTFYEQPTLVSPPEAGFARMFPGADGQLCNTFFKHFVVEFDFIENRVLLHNPTSYQYNGDGSILSMKENESGTYSVPFTFEMLDGKIYNDRVDIDFGGIYPLKIALNNAHKIQVPSDAKETFSYGAQGKATEFSSSIKSMTLGKYSFEKPMAIFGDEKTSRIHPNNLGVIGLPLFKKFKIIFNYFKNEIYIEPNENIDQPFE